MTNRNINSYTCCCKHSCLDVEKWLHPVNLIEHIFRMSIQVDAAGYHTQKYPVQFLILFTSRLPLQSNLFLFYHRMAKLFSIYDIRLTFFLTLGYLSAIRQPADQQIASGYTAQLGLSRALTDCFSCLSWKPELKAEDFDNALMTWLTNDLFFFLNYKILQGRFIVYWKRQTKPITWLAIWVPLYSRLFIFNVLFSFTAYPPTWRVELSDQ